MLAEWILEAGLLALFDTPGVDVQVIYGDTEGLDTLALAALEFLYSKKRVFFNIHKTSNNLFQFNEKDSLIASSGLNFVETLRGKDENKYLKGKYHEILNPKLFKVIKIYTTSSQVY